MGNHLYEIVGQYRELADLANDPDCELTHEAIAATLEGVEGEFNEKAKKVGFLINSVSSNIDVIDTEIKRLQERKKIIENRDKNIRDYLKKNMEALEISRISCDLFDITLAKGRNSVIIDDEKKIPPEFVSVKSELVPDKKALLKAMTGDDAKEIEGAHIQRGESTIRIK